MRYGLYLTFDEKAEKALQNIRRDLTRQVHSLPGVDGKMRPHLTMLIFDDDDHSSVLIRFKPLADKLESFPIKLGGIGHFQGRRHVVFVEPVMSEKLKDSYEHCRTAYTQSTIVSAYNDLALWKPHVTLAKGIKSYTPFKKAKDFAERHWSPAETHVCSFGLIDVQKPTQPLAERVF